MTIKKETTEKVFIEVEPSTKAIVENLVRDMEVRTTFFGMELGNAINLLAVRATMEINDKLTREH